MFTLRLDQQDIVTVQEALAAQPLGKVYNTFLRIQQQIAQQQAAEAPAGEVGAANGKEKKAGVGPA